MAPIAAMAKAARAANCKMAIFSAPAIERISWFSDPLPGLDLRTLSRTILSGQGSARLATPSTITARIPTIKPEAWGRIKRGMLSRCLAESAAIGAVRDESPGCTRSSPRKGITLIDIAACQAALEPFLALRRRPMGEGLGTDITAGHSLYAV